MVIFSHRGIGFGKKENSIEAISAAIQDGFSVEVDLRLNGDTVILSHESIQGRAEISEFDGLLGLIKENQDILFALHLKEDSMVLFHKVGESVRHFKNCFLFVTDFSQEVFINDMFESVGSERLALYVTDKNIDSLLSGKADYFWMDESRQEIYKDLSYFNSFKKKTVCCSPELFAKEHKNRISFFNERVCTKEDLFGICSDFPLNYIGPSKCK